MADRTSHSLASRERMLDEVNREMYARNAELAVRNKTLSLLRDIDEVAMASLEPHELTGQIAQILVREFSFPLVAVAVMEGKHLTWMAAACGDKKSSICDVPVGDRLPIPLSHKENLCVKALKNGKRQTHDWLGKVFTPSFTAEEMERLDEKHGAKFALVFPMCSGKIPVGVLALGLNRAADDLTRYERETIENLLSLIMIAVQKAQTFQALKLTTSKLRVANNKLKALDSLKTEFLSIASHQLRTPLAITKGYVAMLEDGMVGKINKKQHSALENVRQSTESLILLVNHLLDLTRIESGRLQVKMADVDAGAIVHWVGDFLQAHAKEKGVALTLDVPKEPVMTQADPEKLKEVVMNMTDNALKYTEKGSIHIRLERKEGSVVIEVKDTGFGLSPEDKMHLFEKFARGHASKFVKTSSGLGLYVVKKLMEGMGGTIVAESAGKLKGSTFRATLKAATGKARLK